jgi:hypothetical protein
MTEMFRAQILLERRQHEALSEIARQQHKSISETVREIVEQFIATQESQARQQTLQALQELRQMREKQPLYQGDLVDQVRAERDKQMEDVWQQQS